MPDKSEEPSFVGWFWKFLLIWFSVSVLILGISGSRIAVAFSVVWCAGFGGIVWFLKNRIAYVINKYHLRSVFWFALVVVLISAGEEILVYLLGGKLAEPALWSDLIVVCSTWLAWLLMWFLWVCRKSSFSLGEAIAYAGFTGILYEVFISGAFISNPLSLLIESPLAWVIYAVIALVPLQMIKFSGKSRGLIAGVEAIMVPFLVSEVVALTVVFALKALGAPVN